MLSEDKIIAIYCFVDDLLKGVCWQEDKWQNVSDSRDLAHLNHLFGIKVIRKIIECQYFYWSTPYGIHDQGM